MKTIVKTIAAALLLAVTAAIPTPSAADEWPDRYVKVIVVGGAGGSGDVLARVVAGHLSTAFKQQFVIENRAGAGGTLGTQFIASSAPDGYTLGVTLLSTISLAPPINAAVGYDPLHDFTHIAYIAGAPVLLTANTKTGVKTLPEFVRYAEANRFTFATAGVGTDGHLVGELIGQNLKVKTEHVPYKSAAQGITDVVAGHVPFSTLNVGSSTGFVRTGQLNGVAVTSRERLLDYPDLPTFEELGYPAVTMTTWYLLSGPPNMPADIVNKLNLEVRKLVASPEIQARYRREGYLPEDMTPAQVQAFVAAENDRWTPLIKSVGLYHK